MRVVIAGSRYLQHTIGDPSPALKNDYLVVRDAVWEFERKHGRITTIISGTCRYVMRGRTRLNALPEVLLENDVIHGADLLGEYFGRVHRVPVERFPAAWSQHGDDAGPARNEQMIATAQGLIAVFLPDSVGTMDAMRRAALRRLPIVDVCLPQRKKW
jgi:hypothetical protein